MKKLLFVLVAFCSLSAQAQNFSNALKKLTEKVVSIPIQTQTSVKGSDDKELEKQAKNGDAQTQCDIGKRYFSGEEVKFDLKKAKKWFKMAADQGNGEAMYYLSRVAVMENDGNWKDLVEKAANAGYGVAQYEQYQSTGDKQWLQKAADNGHPDALYEVAKMTDDASERLKLLEKAAAQGNSLAQSDAGLLRKQVEEEQERLRKEKEAEQRAEQMKAIEEGRFLPSFDYVWSNIPVLRNSINSAKEQGVISDSEMITFCKWSQWRDEIEKNKIYAYTADFSGLDVVFREHGFTFNYPKDEWSTNLTVDHIGIGQVAIPVQPGVMVPGGKCSFPCNDINVLKRMKDNLDKITFIVLFKPAFVKEVSSVSVGTQKVAIVNPVAMYIVDKNSGSLLLDLSKYIREVGSEAGYNAEMALLESVNKKVKEFYAKRVKEWEEAEAKKTYHKVPKEVRCWACWGAGTVQTFSEGVYYPKRCTNCYGRGYTLEHYY